jgi:hypothetical protein
MAVVNVLSAQLTNRDALPIVPQDSRLAGSAIRGGAGLVAFTSGDDIGSTYRAFAIPAKAIMRSLTVSGPDVGASVDIGLYRTTKNGGALITSGFFSAAKSLDAVTAKSEVVNDNVLTVALMETPLGKQVGPVSFPNDTEFDVVLTSTVAADITGKINVVGSWTEG